MRKTIQFAVCLLLCTAMSFWACTPGKAIDMPIIPETELSELPVSDMMYTVPITVVTESAKVEENPEVMSDSDIELIALMTMAEAESECEEGKRLVIDAILNRMDSAYFPDSVHDVIYQPGQFSPTWNGRLKRCEVREDICQLVREELANRSNHDVIFFTGGGYSAYGVPLFQVGGHYFSSYV